MSAATASDLYFDPYDVEITADPYPVLRRLRDEAPLYYNERYDFYALTRFEDVERALVDRDTFINSRGNVLELIKADAQQPAGTLIFEDPPSHTIHRKLLSRAFTPRRLAALEPQIHERSEEHTSELQSLMRNSYAVFCLTKKKQSALTKNTQ